MKTNSHDFSLQTILPAGTITQLNSTQVLNEHLWTQVLKHVDVDVVK